MNINYIIVQGGRIPLELGIRREAVHASQIRKICSHLRHVSPVVPRPQDNNPEAPIYLLNYNISTVSKTAHKWCAACKIGL